MNAALAQHRENFRKRTEQYARFGHDRFAAARFVAEAGVRERIEFVRGDAARLPFPEGRFGAAAMMAVLHQIAVLGKGGDIT